MDGGADSIEKTLIGVWSEVHRYGRFRSNGAGHLDVQHHFSIRSVRIACRMIPAAIHRNGGDAWTASTKVGVEIRLAEAPTKLDDRDALSLSRIGRSRKRVQMS